MGALSLRSLRQLLNKGTYFVILILRTLSEWSGARHLHCGHNTAFMSEKIYSHE